MKNLLKKFDWKAIGGMYLLSAVIFGIMAGYEHKWNYLWGGLIAVSVLTLFAMIKIAFEKDRKTQWSIKAARGYAGNEPNTINIFFEEHPGYLNVNFYGMAPTRLNRDGVVELHRTLTEILKDYSVKA